MANYGPGPICSPLNFLIQLSGFNKEPNTFSFSDTKLATLCNFRTQCGPPVRQLSDWCAGPQTSPPWSPPVILLLQTSGQLVGSSCSCFLLKNIHMAGWDVLHSDVPITDSVLLVSFCWLPSSRSPLGVPSFQGVVGHMPTLADVQHYDTVIGSHLEVSTVWASGSSSHCHRGEQTPPLH